MAKREDEGRLKLIIRVLTISFASFHLYTGIFGILVPSLQRPIHLVFAAVLAFLIYSPTKKEAGKHWLWIDSFLACATFFAFSYFVYHNNDLSEWMVFVSDFGNEEFFVSIVCMLLLLEATRRASGLPLMIVGVAFILYIPVSPN